MVTGKSVTSALIALGANYTADTRLLTERISAAFTQIESASISVLSISDNFVTPSFPAGLGPDYVNAAGKVSTYLSRYEFLARLHEIEHDFGRERIQRWGQRSLDLDIIDFGGQVVPDIQTYKKWRELPLSQQMETTPAELILPHPRLQDRAFVLVPLQQVAGDWRHPVTGVDVASMLRKLPEAEKNAIRPV